LLERVDVLEDRLEGHEIQKTHVHAPKGDSWEGNDFII
jgi:hypothetical protein